MVSLDVNISIRVTLEKKAEGYTKVNVYLQHINKTVAVNIPNGVAVGRVFRLRVMLISVSPISCIHPHNQNHQNQKERRYMRE